MAHTTLHESVDEEALRTALVEAGPRGIALRGLGRSYGDAAQRSGGTTAILRGHGGPSWADRERGVVRSPAHVSMAELIEFADADGFFVPVTPGTRFVTLGGALAADIHGKDHHVAGSIGAHVERFTLLLADGSLRSVDRDGDLELFRATIGGMGLTGAILDIDVAMIKVPGNRILVETYRTPDLDATMAAMVDAEESYRYSVAWIDLMAGGRQMGRGVVSNGNHTSDRSDAEPLRAPRVGVPSPWRLGVVNRPGVKVFNEGWFRKAPATSTTTVERYDGFFYPLDMVRNWNRLYGPRGFLQYQFVMPFESEGRVASVVESLSGSGLPIFLAVLKRFGPAGDGYLSFPRSGWTLAMDIPIPADARPMEALLRSIDREVVQGGGRVYLAKDSRLSSDMVPAMYPELDRFRSVCERVDPTGRFQTDLAARLKL